MLQKFLYRVDTKIKTLSKNQEGFTLIETLLVMGILVLLLAIVIIAINPARQFATANNTKRSSDVVAILNAIQQYMVDNLGNLPVGMPAGGAGVRTIASGAGNADICSSLVTKYIAALPADPTATSSAPIINCSSYNSGYVASVSATDNRITVSAPNAQLGATIGVTR